MYLILATKEVLKVAMVTHILVATVTLILVAMVTLGLGSTLHQYC